MIRKLVISERFYEYIKLINDSLMTMNKRISGAIAKRSPRLNANTKALIQQAALSVGRKLHTRALRNCTCYNLFARAHVSQI